MDKVPPHSIDAEQGLISAILVNPDRLDDVQYITPDMFYNKTHVKIYEHILRIAQTGKMPDIVTVNSSLTQTGDIEDIGITYLMEIAEKVVNDRYAEQHAEIVRDNFIRRQYIALSQELSIASYDRFTEVNELNNYAEKSFFDITENTIRTEPEKLASIHQQTLEHISKISTQKSELIGVPSGLTELDRLTLGFQKSDLILIAARPSMGKTAFSLRISKNAAELGYKILFFSLEMSKRQLSYRLLADRFTEINDLKVGKDIDWEEIEKSAGGEYAGNIYVDDTPALKATEIRSISRKFKKKIDIDMIVIDYLQLARGDDTLKQNGNRYVGDISKTFKNIAKELDIPVIALSQLNRAVEARSNPLPILSDLRESGELEQDADIVMFLTRFIRLPEKYWYDLDGNDMRGKAYIDVAKNRNGKCDKILTTASDDAMHWGYSETF